MAKQIHLPVSIAVAAVLWFWMFSPWTGHLVNFWICMSCSAVILSALAIFGNGGLGDCRRTSLRNAVLQLCLGIAIAFMLWGVFWVGDKLSQLMFDFARGQVDSVYDMKDGSSPYAVTVLLLFLIGPAEEYFWRGYVQKALSGRCGRNTAFLVTTAIYALVHVWSFNFMLVMAALVAGAVWGFIYKERPEALPALVISHALWDALVFTILPI